MNSKIENLIREMSELDSNGASTEKIAELMEVAVKEFTKILERSGATERVALDVVNTFCMTVMYSILTKADISKTFFMQQHYLRYFADIIQSKNFDIPFGMSIIFKGKDDEKNNN